MTTIDFVRFHCFFHLVWLAALIVALFVAEAVNAAGTRSDEWLDCELLRIRSPGRIVEIHERLSSPWRRKNISEAFRKFEERQAKAEEIRQKLFENKHQKLRDLIDRVDAVKKMRRNLMEKKRVILNAKLAKAEQKRKLQIEAIVKKARDEEEKVHEVAFINTLEADNRRHDVMTRHIGHANRLQNLQEERQRKLEEKAAREAAVEERRRVAEEQRRQQLLEIAERTRKRQQKIERQKFEQERKRLQQSLEKSREREERKAEMKAAQQATSEELLHRIQNQQVKTCRRYEMNLELIKHRAIEMSLPHNATTTMESPCTAEPASTTRHPETKRNPSSYRASSDSSCEKVQRSKDTASGSKASANIVRKKASKSDRLHAAGSRMMVDGGCCLDKMKVVNSGTSKLLNRKRAKLKKQFLETASGYTISYICDTAFRDHLSRLEKLHLPFSTLLEKFKTYRTWLPSDVRAFQKIMCDLRKFFASEVKENEKQLMFHSVGFQRLIVEFMNMFEKISVDDAPVLSRKCFYDICDLLLMSLKQSFTLCLNFFCSGSCFVILNVLCCQWKVYLKGFDEATTHKNVALLKICVAVLRVLDSVFSCLVSWLKVSPSLLNSFPGKEKGFLRCISQFLSYTALTNFLSFTSAYIHAFSNADVLNEEASSYLLGLIHVVSSLFTLLVFSKNLAIDIAYDQLASLTTTLRSTELLGSITLLYRLLLNPDVVSTLSNERSSPAMLSPFASKVVLATLDCCNAVAMINLQAFQDALSQQVSLEYRHIASFLLNYSNRYSNAEILNRTIVSIGYFTCGNEANQNLIHSGNLPTVLHQLLLLPFQYFCDDEQKHILFPTLICCSFNNAINRQILEEEMDCNRLADYVEESMKASDAVNSIADPWNFRFRFAKESLRQAIAYFRVPLAKQ